MKPTKSINVTGRSDWVYRNSAKTDVAATLARERKRLREQAEISRAADLERISKVRNLR